MSDIDATPMTASAPETPALTFGQAFNYPFNRAIGLLNILWILVPIFGCFAVAGYIIRIARGFATGLYQELPKFSFWSDCGHGFMMMLRAIPFLLAYAVVLGVAGWILAMVGTPEWLLVVANILVSVLVLPILTINFVRHGTVASYFDFGVVSPVFEHIGDYLLAVIKDIALFLVFLVLSLVLVGIPAMSFTKYIFLADFYRRRVG